MSGEAGSSADRSAGQWRGDQERRGRSLRATVDTWSFGITLRSNQGRLEIAAAGGADQRSAKNADRPMNQSREAHHSARPLHSP